MKCPGSPTPLRGLRQAARDFDIDDRKRNRDAALGFENAVQATVLRVVVILVVAPEARFHEQVLVGGFDKAATVGKIAGALGDGERMMIELRDAGAGVEMGIFDARDLERGAVEFDSRGPAREQVQERLCFRFLHLCP